ncbi:MAG: sulfatase-like hydrolase/transferase [Candidatus Schekmanbacteria bacterium]|nr:sulfatase-like hydrolase/transferase [Candidatus Schekmanbacteria bacterium]
MIKRSARIGLLGTVLLLTAAAVAALFRGSPPAGPVIVISIDTLRADHLPVYGYDHIVTPAISAFASEGIVFANCYAQVPQTLPSHASIFTGRQPYEHGARDNIGFALRAEVPTVAEAFRARGFETGAAVSAMVMREDSGLNRGFDFYDADIRMPSTATGVRRRPRSMADLQRDGGKTVEVAKSWITGRKDGRFFFFLHLYEPHSPYSPPERYRLGRPSAYDGEIAYADELVGSFLAFLRVKNLYESATIILLSDHGEALGDHGELEHGVFLYQETLHVPLIVKLPGQARAGTRVAAPVQHIDIAPALANLYGLGDTVKGGGTDLLAIDDAAGISPRALYSESLYARYHFGWSELFSLTDATHKFISAPRPELYDLAQDPHERANLASAQPTLLAARQQIMETEHQGRFAFGAPSETAKSTLEQLEALGYVGAPAAGTAGSAEERADPKDKIAIVGEIQQGLQAEFSGALGKACEIFQQILAANPGMADVWRYLARANKKRGHLDAHIDGLLKVIELAPDDRLALDEIVEALVRANRTKEAIDFAEIAAEHDPKEGEALVARLYFDIGDFALAREHARVAQEADPQGVTTDFIEGLILHREGSFERSHTVLARAAVALEGPGTLSPPRDLHFYLADDLGRLGRDGEAEEHFRKELDEYPENVNATIRLATLYKAQGKERLAMETLEDLLHADPTPRSYLAVIQASLVFRNERRALSWSYELLERFPDEPGLREQLRELQEAAR